MKRSLSLFSILLMGVGFAQAAPQLYDITLSNAEKFTQCRIAYETESLIKFTGTDKKGNVVTKEVKASSVLLKKEVATKAPKKDKAKPAPVSKETNTEQQEPTTEPTTEEPAAETPTEPEAPESTETTDAEETSQPTLNGPSSRESTLNAINARLSEIEKKKATIEELPRNFNSRYSSTKSTIEKNLTKIEASCSEVDNLQAQYDALTNAYFGYEIVKDLDRTKYAVDGKAAYDAMVMDMNQKKSSRKIGGLDKFEELRESYQGIPEYPQAYDWYIKTLKDLDRKWEKSIQKEEARRAKLNSNKLSEQTARDQAEYDKLEDMLEKNDEHIAQVWFNPGARNLVMLKKAKNKVEDALRRNERNKPHEQTGKVIELINAFWVSTDKAKDLMIAGDLEQAKEEMDNNEDFKKIVRLHQSLLPEEYKKPLKEQRDALYSELKDRIQKRRNMQRNLDSKRSALNRLAESTNNQVDRLEELVNEAIEAEKEAAAEAAAEAAEEAAEEGEASEEETSEAEAE